MLLDLRSLWEVQADVPIVFPADVATHGGDLGHVVSDTGRRLRFPQPPEKPFDNRPAIAALFEAGALSEEEFVALLAA